MAPAVLTSCGRQVAQLQILTRISDEIPAERAGNQTKYAPEQWQLFAAASVG